MDDMNTNNEIAKTEGRSIAKSARTFTVDGLEKALLRKFPKEYAEDWDVTGLTVGERGLPVKKVAVALDATVKAIRAASKLGADVLVTHHPPFLQGPMDFSPEDSVALSPGAGVWAAITGKVALMDFHTALDVSKEAQAALPGLLGLEYTGKLLETVDGCDDKGYGQICSISPSDGSEITLGRLAARCMSVFGRTSKVWGDFDSKVRSCATVLGSAGNVAHTALEQGIDCIVCGELRYHDALELSEAGLGIIELGHDVSEMPLVAVLAGALADVGVQPEDIVMIDQADNWAVPEAIRL